MNKGSETKKWIPQGWILEIEQDDSSDNSMTVLTSDIKKQLEVIRTEIQKQSESDSESAISQFQTSQTQFEQTYQFALKPSLSNGGQGIRFCKHLEDVEEILLGNLKSQEYVLQRCLKPAILLEGKKFHIRALVLVSGCMRTGRFTVSLHEPSIGCLLAKDEYEERGESESNQSNVESQLLTNFCISGNYFKRFSNSESDSSDELSSKTKSQLLSRMKECLTDVFSVFAKRPLFFCPLPNQFEIFGVDFLVVNSDESDDQVTVKILEINSQPNFELYGDDDIRQQICHDLVGVQNWEMDKIKNLHKNDNLNQNTDNDDYSIMDHVFDSDIGLDVYQQYQNLKIALAHHNFTLVYQSQNPPFKATTIREALRLFDKRINNAGLLLTASNAGNAGSSGLGITRRKKDKIVVSQRG